MSDFEIGIGARNRASEILREVADQVRSTADTVTQAATITQEANHRIEISFQTIANVAGIAAAALAAFQVGSFITDSFAKFDAADKSLKSFTNTLALAAGSGVAEQSAKGFKELANSIEFATNIDATKLIDLMKSASSKGVDSVQLRDATKAAVGLAEAFGTDLAGGLDKVVQASRGNFSAFENLVPQINSLATSEEKLALVSKLASDGLLLKKQSASDAAFVFERMTVQSNNLRASVGAMLDPFRDLAYEGIAVVSEMINQSLQPAVQACDGIFSTFKETAIAVGKSFSESIVLGFVAGETAIKRFDDVMKLMEVAIELSLVSISGKFQHTFTNVIPVYVAYFKKEMHNLTADLAVNASFMVEDIGNRLGADFAAKYQLLLGNFETARDIYLRDVKLGGDLTDQWNDWTFIAGKLPEIAERTVSDTEKRLQAKLDELTNSLGQSITVSFGERMDAIKKGIEDKPLDVEIDLKLDPDQAKKLKETISPSPQAIESRIMVRGPDQNPNAETAANTKATLEETKAFNRKMDKLLNSFDVDRRESVKLEVIV